MNNNIIYMLSVVDKLNELNEKINQALGGKLDNVFVGTVILFILVAVAFFGIRELNK